MKKIWTIPQNFQSIDVVLFLMALLKAVISLFKLSEQFQRQQREKDEDLLLSAYKSFS